MERLRRDHLSAAVWFYHRFAIASTVFAPVLGARVLLLVVECRGSAHMLEILIGALSRQPSLAAVTLNLQSRDFVLNRTNRRSRLT